MLAGACRHGSAVRLPRTVTPPWDAAVPAVFGACVASGPDELRTVASLVGPAGWLVLVQGEPQAMGSVCEVAPGTARHAGAGLEPHGAGDRVLSGRHGPPNSLAPLLIHCALLVKKIFAAPIAT